MMKGALKDAVNPGFKKDGKAATYADLESVWEAIRTPLMANELAVTQTMDVAQPGQVRIITTLMHKSGQWIRSDLSLPCSAPTAHAYGSGISYGRRYGLAAILGVIQSDDDGNEATEQSKQAAQKPTIRTESPIAPRKDAKPGPTIHPEPKVPGEGSNDARILAGKFEGKIISDISTEDLKNYFEELNSQLYAAKITAAELKGVKLKTYQLVENELELRLNGGK
jgi:hypothetical protein